MGETDLRDVNLKQEALIQEGEVEIYDDLLYDLEGKDGKKIKPKVGTKLNKEAVIVLYNQGMPDEAETET